MKNEPCHVLLIDDNPDDRADLRQMLLRGSPRRWFFTEAQLGVDGLARARERGARPFDCVLLDCHLPDMNAQEVLAALCNESGMTACPVLVVTGSDREDGPKLLRAGAQDYIGKDWITPESLTRAVENAIGRFALLAERAGALELLRLERARLAQALTSGQMGVYDWNLVEDTLWWSPETYLVFGVAAGSFTPSRDAFSALVHPDDRELLWQTFDDAVAQRRSFRHEYRILVPDGTVRWVAGQAETQRDVEGRSLRHFGVVMDVTERKHAESQMKVAMAAAVKANRAKSDFLSSMSHELRSPLNSILGFAQLIDSGSPPPSPRHKASVDQILQAGWHLLELINENLDLSLIESGKLSLAAQRLSLAEVLDDCRAMIEPQARERAIRLSLPALHLPCFVHADPTRTKQVFLNLLSNAVKYNRPGGEVDVTFSALDAQHTRISFRDTGAGLSASQLAELFEPFNRLGQETGAIEGTGIGLVVCKRLVEMMGGAIGARSVVGEGSLFWIDLSSATELPVREGEILPTMAAEPELPSVVRRPALRAEGDTTTASA